MPRTTSGRLRSVAMAVEKALLGGLTSAEREEQGVLSTDGKASLCLYETNENPAPLHLAFLAANRQQVDDFHRAAIVAGGTDNGAPGLRLQYNANYYAAFDQPFISADGRYVAWMCACSPRLGAMCTGLAGPERSGS